MKFLRYKQVWCMRYISFQYSNLSASLAPESLRWNGMLYRSAASVDRNRHRKCCRQSARDIYVVYEKKSFKMIKKAHNHIILEIGLLYCFNP